MMNGAYGGLSQGYELALQMTTLGRTAELVYVVNKL